MGAKEYEMPNGRKVVFEFDENGVGKITLEAMDSLMGMVNIDLVRCGECKWFYKDQEIPWCSIWANETSDVNFCNYGERRTE